MLVLNDKMVELGNFPDGTLLFHVDENMYGEHATIKWFYNNDKELVALIFLTKHLREHGVSKIELYMPYIPNARQDRVKSEKDVFTLKYFASIINWLDFTTVTVLDPHSNVSEALFNHIVVQNPKLFIFDTFNIISMLEGVEPIFFYPDEGASKRYSDFYDVPYAFGIKKRDWKTGKIMGLNVAGATEEISGRNVLIVDDICSKGGTFYFAAKKLKEIGAKNVYLYITHCENTILEGELIKSGLVKKIFTTNSIFTASHPLIKVFDCYN